MVNKVSAGIVSLSKSKLIIISSLVLLIILQIIMMSKPLGLAEIESIAPKVKILDTRFNYTNAQAHETLSNLGSTGQKAYRNLLITDFFYILCYTAFVMITLTAVLRKIFPAIVAFNSVWIIAVF